MLDPDPVWFASRKGTTFIYTDDAWRQQFIERPHARIECAGVDGEWAAIVERTEESDRVHAITDESKLPLLSRDRPLFYYSTREQQPQGDVTRGCLYVLPATTLSDPNFQNGDRM